MAVPPALVAELIAPVAADPPAPVVVPVLVLTVAPLVAADTWVLTPAPVLPVVPSTLPETLPDPPRPAVVPVVPIVAELPLVPSPGITGCGFRTLESPHEATSATLTSATQLIVPRAICLMRNAKLAALETLYDDASGVLVVTKDGVPMVEASLRTEAGRAAIEYFFHDFMGGEARGPVKILESPGHSFSDVSAKVAHIVNLATVEDLAATINREIHALRFRANIYLTGWKPWAEFDLIGKTIRAGSVEFEITKRVVRCAATEVNPDTAERDIDIPDAIWRKTGDSDLGVYARVVTAGTIAAGDKVEIVD